MLNQIGFDELLEKVFLNKNMDKLIEDGYLENNSFSGEVHEKMYEVVFKYLENNIELENINIFRHVS
jgi:hypothetical protein